MCLHRVVQELALADNVVWYYGPHRARVPSRIATSLSALGFEGGPAFSTAMTAQRASSTDMDETLNIMDLLHSARATRCADPRDHIYALLGLLAQRIQLDVDYQQPV